MVRDGSAPTAEALKDHLLSVHGHDPGFTEDLASRARDVSGRNTYGWLADLVDPAKHKRVLDLACGSGPLTALCHQRFGDAVELIAVDMSPHELAIAKTRVPPAAAKFHSGLAQDLSMIDDGGVDVVLCHWALTVMDPVEPVLREVARVLAPEGIFAAVVDGDHATAPLYDAVCALIFKHVQQDIPGYGNTDLGDPRVRDAKRLTELAKSVFSGSDVSVDPAVFKLSDTPAALAADVSRFFYAAFVLGDEARQRMLADLAAHFSGAGQGKFLMPVNRLVVRPPAEGASDGFAHRP